MPLFLTLTKFTEDSFTAMTARPSNRAEAVSRVMSSHGGKLLHFYWTFGEADVAFIYEAPDNETAMAALMALYSRGAVDTHRTSVLISNDEAMRAMERAGKVQTGYRTPREEWLGWQDEGGEG